MRILKARSSIKITPSRPVTRTNRVLKRCVFKIPCKNTHFSSLEWETVTRCYLTQCINQMGLESQLPPKIVTLVSSDGDLPDSWGAPRPAPCTLNSTPFTLHPKPDTPRSTPYTLHPHPTPHTPHPTPVGLVGSVRVRRRRVGSSPLYRSSSLIRNRPPS